MSGVSVLCVADERAGDDVEVAVAVEINGLRALNAGERGERVLDERICALVLEPLNAVIRLQDVIVERIAVRHEDVEIAVLVEIDDLDAR